MLIGAILGGLGSVINTGLSIYQQKQQNEADEKRRSDEFEMAKINATRDTQIASYTNESNSGQASQWIIDVLRLVRPTITLYSLILVTLFWFVANDVDKALIITSVLDIASMAVAWWFGDRRLNNR